MALTRRELHRERHQVGHENVVLFIYVVIALVLLILWGESSRTGLIGWAIALGSTAPLFRLTPTLELPYEQWFAAEAISKALVGFAYGTITWVALPESELHQALLCVVLVGVMVASASYSAQLAGIHAAFLMPFTAVAVTGFLTRPYGLGICAVICAVAFGFSMRMAAEHRAGNKSVIELILERASLIEELGAERDALTSANQRLERQAWTDSLTGVANRAAVMRNLDQRLNNIETGSVLRERVTVAYVDLNGFKQVNDSGGHVAGDRLLKAVTSRMEDLDGDDTFVGRVGGDEFVVLSTRRVDDLGQRIEQLFDEPFETIDTTVRLSAGIGLATTTRRADPDEVLKRADAALYRHKRTESDRQWSVYDESLRDELARQEDLDTRVVAALEGGDIQAWYQPVVDMRTCTIVGAEALARWVDGDVVRSAGSFIDALVRKNRIPDLTSIMVADIARVHATMRSAGITPLRINVNVPAPQLEWVLDEVVTPEMLPLLAIEVTEGDAFNDASQIARLVSRAQAGGATVLIDDFGVAYSSLSRATEIPVDGLKIDCAFVRQLTTDRRSAAVVETMVDLATRLEVGLVAEGVEEGEQADALLKLGVVKAQGFLYSPAVSPHAFANWVIDDYRFGVTTPLAA